MNDEKWIEIKERIKESFGLEEEKKEDDFFYDDLENQFRGEKETIIFTNPSGRFKIERLKRPMILEKKPHYHKGAGGTAKMEFTVSEEKIISTINAFLFDQKEEEWNEIDLRGGNISF